ncbi:MAG: phosphoenolpyruvate---glycerone phosphotransferase subunit DhaL [Gaiellaceae bacterium]|nr:phosphoenolpyruvate---glycerone phosphotransferase subunit DhaL [Gaiellaceae bacterium]
MIGVAAIGEFFAAYLEAIEEAQASLDRLDAVAGDGDHGATMLMGMREVVAAQTGAQGTPAQALRVAGEAFGSVGGSIGPLWGTALVRAARVADERPSIDGPVAAEMLTAAVAGLRDRGRSELGDKTLLDVMEPATHVFAEAVEGGLAAEAALQRGVEAAQLALAGTAGLAARRGRARRLAARSVGSVDPGAASACLAWETAATLRSHM